MSDDLVLLSPHSTAECVSRLRAALRPGDFWMWADELMDIDRCFGRVSDTKFTLWRGGALYLAYHPLSRTLCYGNLAAEANGARITVRFRYSVPVRLFATLWGFVMIGAAVVVSNAALAARPDMYAMSVFGVSALVLVSLGMAILYEVYRPPRLTRKRRFLLDFITTTLDAKPEGAASVAPKGAHSN